MQQSNVLRFMHVRSPREQPRTSDDVDDVDLEAGRLAAELLLSASQQTNNIQGTVLAAANEARSNSDFSLKKFSGVLKKKERIVSIIESMDADQLPQELTTLLRNEYESLIESRINIETELQLILLEPVSNAEVHDLNWLSNLGRIMHALGTGPQSTEHIRDFHVRKPTLTPTLSSALSSLTVAEPQSQVTRPTTSNLHELREEYSGLIAQKKYVERIASRRISLWRKFEDAVQAELNDRVDGQPASSAPDKTGPKPNSDTSSRYRDALVRAQEAARNQLSIADVGALASDLLTNNEIKALPGLLEASGETISFETAIGNIEARLVDVGRDLARALNNAKECV